MAAIGIDITPRMAQIAPNRVGGLAEALRHVAGAGLDGPPVVRSPLIEHAPAGPVRPLRLTTTSLPDSSSWVATWWPIWPVPNTTWRAIANGDVFGISSTGWTYTLILTFLTGVAAHGLMVFAQRTIPIGTIGITQVIQPPLAIVWSFLLLGERLNGWQFVGIAIVLSGLLAFLVMNQRGNATVAADSAQALDLEPTAHPE